MPKLGEKYTVIPNSQPYYVIESVEDEEGNLAAGRPMAIAAWKVFYEENDDNSHFAMPVGVHGGGFFDDFAIWNSETDVWEIPEDKNGRGMDDLVNAFRQNAELRTSKK